MDTETTREQELFAAAMAIVAPADRDTFLDRACDGDSDLRARVAKLLVAHARSESFFQECLTGFTTAVEEMPPVSDDDPSLNPADEIIGTFVGRYKLLKTLGEGGCGVVY